jgi:hypothetical protein
LQNILHAFAGLMSRVGEKNSRAVGNPEIVVRDSGFALARAPE